MTLALGPACEFVRYPALSCIWFLWCELLIHDGGRARQGEGVAEMNDPCHPCPANAAVQGHRGEYGLCRAAWDEEGRPKHHMVGLLAPEGKGGGQAKALEVEGGRGMSAKVGQGIHRWAGRVGEKEGAPSR